MNEKEQTLFDILDIVIGESQICSADGAQITREDVRGRCKKENVCMCRCIYVSMLMYMGYSKTTIAAFIGRTEQAVSDILLAAHEYKKKSWAYRVVDAKSTLKCSEIRNRY